MAERLNLGDLIYRLGFENEEEFLRSIDSTFDHGAEVATESGAEAGRGWTEQFKATFSGAAIGSFIGTVFSQAFMQAGRAVRQFFGDSLRASRDFETALSNIASLGGQTQEQMEALRRGVLDLAPAVGEGPEALTTALYDVVSAGFDGEDALQVLEAATMGARAGLTDTKVAADAVTTALNAYNLEASESTRITDALQTTVALGKTTWDELGAAIGQVIPIAATADVEIEELGAALATLTGQGINTNQAVTGIRQTLVSILNPSTQARNLARDLGIEFNAQALRARGLAGVLDDVQEATQGNEEQLATLLGRVEALNAVLALTSDSGGRRFLEAQEAMTEASGATEAAFEQQMSTAEAADRRFQASMEVIQIAIGEQFTPSIRDAQNLFADFVLGFLRQSDELQAGASQDMAASGEAIRGLVDTIWGGVQSAARSFSHFLTWFEFTAQGVELEAETTAERLGAFFGSMLHTVISTIGSATRAIGEFLVGTRERFQEFLGQFVDLTPAPRGGASGARGDEDLPVWEPPAPDEPEVPDRPDRGEPPSEEPPPVDEVGDGTGTGTGRPEAEVDPVVEEAGRIRAHFELLRMLRESDRIDAEAFEQHIEAHLRRLGRMYDEAETQEQRLAILRAEQGLVNELERMHERAAAEAERAREEAIARAQAELGIEGLAESAREWVTGVADAAQEAKAERERAAREAAELEEQQRQLSARLEIEYLQTTGEEREAALERERQVYEERLRLAEGNAELREQIERNYAASVEQINADFDERERQRRERQEREERLAAERRAEEAARFAQQQAQERADREQQAAEAQRRAEITRLQMAGQELEAELMMLEDRYQREFELARGNAEAVTAILEALMAERRAIMERHAEAEAEAAQRNLERREQEIWAVLEAHQRAEAERERLARRARDAALDVEIEYLDLIGDARGAALAREDRRLAQELERAEEHALDREEITRNHNLRVAAINERFDADEEQRAFEAERQRIQAIIDAEGELTEAKRRELIQRLEEELIALQASEDANIGRIRAIEAALDRLRGVVGLDLEQVTQQLESQVMQAGRALVDGIREGDLEGALEGIFDRATDFFIDQMLRAILGPIAQSFAQAMAPQMVPGAAGAAGAAGAINPATLILGIGAMLFGGLLGSLGGGSRTRRPTHEESRAGATGGAPAITYNLTANVNVTAGADFDDPAFYQTWRAETERLVVSLLRRARESRAA